MIFYFKVIGFCFILIIKIIYLEKETIVETKHVIKEEIRKEPIQTNKQNDIKNPKTNKVEDSKTEEIQEEEVVNSSKNKKRKRKKRNKKKKKDLKSSKFSIFLAYISYDTIHLSFIKYLQIYHHTTYSIVLGIYE